MSPKQLRLFGIKLNRTGQPVLDEGEPVYFNNKFVAKRKRDDLAEETGEDYSVTLGPDHRRYISVK